MGPGLAKPGFGVNSRNPVSLCPFGHKTHPLQWMWACLWWGGGRQLSHVAAFCILGNSTHRIWSLPICYSLLLLWTLYTFWLRPLWLTGELLQEPQCPAYPSWNTDGSGLFVYSSARLALICQLQWTGTHLWGFRGLYPGKVQHV